MTDTKIKHIKSAVRGKVPTPETLEWGQIAVNYNAEEPFLSIKDSNDQIAKFPSEAAIAGVISGQVESVVEEVLPTVVGENYPTKAEVNDEINALSASTDTKLEQKADKSEIPSLDGYATENWVQEQGYLTEHQSLDGYATEQWVTNQHYLTEHQDISGLATKQELSEGLAGKSNTGHTHTVSDITNFPTIPSATSDLNNDSGYITSGYTYSKTESDNKYALKGDVPTDVYTKQETDEAISGATQDMATKTWVGEQGYLTEHQSLADYYTKEQVDSEISGATEGLASETWVQNQGYLTQHQDISNLATKQEVNDLSGATDTKLALKADISDIPDVSNYFDDAQYDSSTKRINFYHGETIKAYVDATDFIKDGMVDNVDIETLSGSTYLVITFNTDSGKEPINIPIADIFNAANYYTKSEVDNAISGATQDMATQTWVTSQGYLTQHQDISNLATKQEVETLSGATDTKLAGKQDTLVAGENITISGNTISASGGGGSSYTAGRGIGISGDTIYNTWEFVNGLSLNEHYNIVSLNIPLRRGSMTYSLRSDNVSYPSTASGEFSIAYGYSNKASGKASIAIGGLDIYAEGNTASGPNSLAIGRGNQASELLSIAKGYHNNSTNEYEETGGRFNVSHKASDTFGDSGNTLFSVGNGTAENSRHNAFEIRQNGDIYITKDGSDVKLQDQLGGGGSITIDPALDPTSSNAVANSAITEAISAKFDASGITEYYTSTEVDNAISAATSTKQDTLIAGENITISGNTISASGGGSSYTAGTNMEITSGGTINCKIPVNTGSYNDYKSDLSFGTGINLGSDYYRIGIGRNINFGSGSRTGNSIAICTSQNNSSIKANIYGKYSISIGYKASIGTADNLDGVANSAVAIGSNVKANKDSSVVLGAYSETNAESSVAIGYHNLANAEHSFNCGKFNIGQTDTLFELGNGTAYNSRSNAVEVKNNGDVYIMLDGQMVKLQDHLGGGGGSITIDPALDPSSPNAVANSAITESLSAKFDASGITDYYTSTEVDNAISAATSTKQDTLVAGEGISISGNTISATGGGGGGGMTEDTELLLATAITDLNDRKADTSVVNSKFSGLNKKFGSYVTTSALNTRLADYETALDEQNIEEVAAYALNDLNNRKQDKLIAGEGISISGNTISATGGGGTTYTAGDGISISGTTISAVPDASITSGSTNSVQSAAIYTQFDGMQLKKITQADYDLLPTKDSNTLYIIINNN